jgi:hypothetical protein
MDYTNEQIKKLTKEELLQMVLDVRQAVSTENYDRVKEEEQPQFPADFIRGYVAAIVGKELSF